MGRLVSRSGRKRFREINVTPLVDVMLVLLVVFMVTAPLLTNGLEIELPKVKASNTPIKDGKLLVSITAEGRVVFGEDDVTDRVRAALEENVRVQAEKELYIRADENVRYGVVAHVVSAARLSGVDSLNLLVSPEEPQPAEAEATSSAKPPRAKP